MLHHALRIHHGARHLRPAVGRLHPVSLHAALPDAARAVRRRVRRSTYTLGRAISIAVAGRHRRVAAFASLASPRIEHARVGPGVRRRRARARPVRRAAIRSSRAGTTSCAPTRCSSFMVTAGIAGAAALGARRRRHRAATRKVAAGAAMLALAFFCKQTGIFYVAFGGAIVARAQLAARARRTSRSPARSASAARGCSNRSTDGWFWTYVSKIHRAHDFNMDRFWTSFGNILWHFPALTIVDRGRRWSSSRVTVVATARAPARGAAVRCCGRARSRCRPSSARSAGAPSSRTSTRTCRRSCTARSPPAPRCPRSPRARAARLAARAAARELRRDRVAALAAALAARDHLLRSRAGSRSAFIPTAADVAAGDRLIERHRAIDGDVWMPSHPWYLRARRQDAARPSHGHQGRHDAPDPARSSASTTRSRNARVLRDRARQTRDLLASSCRALAAHYRPALKLPADERPRVYTGAQRRARLDLDARDRRRRRPPARSVVFDFEAPTLDRGWTRSGPAWGDGPVDRARCPARTSSLGATGQRFATSMHGGDAATGRVTSPSVRARRRAAHAARSAAAPTRRSCASSCGSTDTIVAHRGRARARRRRAAHDRDRSIDDLRGKRGTLVLVDDSPTGHLDRRRRLAVAVARPVGFVTQRRRARLPVVTPDARRRPRARTCCCPTASAGRSIPTSR